MFFKKEKIPEVPVPYKNECQKIVECLVCPCKV